MDEIVDALTDEQAGLSGLLEHRLEPDWRRLTRCEGWTVADVVLHLAQTNELAILSARGDSIDAIEEFGRASGRDTDAIDAAAELSVQMERGAPTAVLRERWQQSATVLERTLRGCDPHTRVTWVAGELSVRTLATTRLAETWIHSGDVAGAFGVEQPPTDRLRHIARLAWRTLPYAFAHSGRELAGPVAFVLAGPSGDRWDFVPDVAPLTVVRGDAHELCLVAARRVAAAETALQGEGPDARAVLELVRTYA